MYLPLPFDPDQVWGVKPRHHLRGSIGGCAYRGAIEDFDGARGLSLGPAWRRDNGLVPGAVVAVILDAEGPQRGDLAPDLAQALEAEPSAGAFFDALAQFYRKAYLRWIDGTKDRPQVRAARIAAVVALLKAGQKQRPPG